MKKKICVPMFLIIVIAVCPFFYQATSFAEKTVGCDQVENGKFVVFGSIGTNLLLGSRLFFNDDESFEISSMEGTGLYTVVSENLYMEATLDDLDASLTYHFKIFLINKFIVCFGFTTDIGETVPEEYFFWGFVGFAI